jgi:hypothetical protein
VEWADGAEILMRVRLLIHRDGATLYDGTHDVYDADSFGQACAQAWNRVQEREFGSATSVGALFDTMETRTLDSLLGAEIRLSRA